MHRLPRLPSLFCLLALLLAPAAAQAARPFITDDARIVDEGGWQLETYVKSQRGFHEREFWFLPAHNPRGLGPVEFTLGMVDIDSTLSGNSSVVIGQAKTLLRATATNDWGFALTLGVGRQKPFQAPRNTNPFFNAIASRSMFDDRVIAHFNLGAQGDRTAGLTRGTWGVGTEFMLAGPRVIGIVETYGQRFEKPTLHAGLRLWLVPDRVQLDATAGRQDANPDRRFFTIGLRLIY